MAENKTKKRIYIVTGANGFLGNNIVRKLQDQKCEIRALILPNDKSPALDGLNCKKYFGDITNIDSLKDIFDVPKNTEVFVIHCAAFVYIKSRNNKKVFDINLGGTRNIVQKVLEINAKLVYVNSVHAITEKPNGEVMTEITDFDSTKVVGCYAKSKAETAKYVLQMVKEKGLNACIMQPSGIIGPNDYSGTHLTQLFIVFANHKLPACVKGGYDFVDVRDVADGVISACDKGKTGECYILSNEFVPVLSLVNMCADVLEKKRLKSLFPMWFARMFAPFAELYYNIKKQTPLFTSYSLYTLRSNSNFSHKKADKELGYKTRNIYETVKDTVLWLKEIGKIK